MIVVDASAVVEALTVEDSPAAAVFGQVDVLASPAHMDAEAGHALRGLVREGVLASREAAACLRDLASARIERVPIVPLLGRAFELRENMTFYDALYVALAELHDLRLVTSDRKFARVPQIRCEVQVLG